MLSNWFNRTGALALHGTLAGLKPGQKAKISAVQTVGPRAQRLYEMGLVEGIEVQLVRRAPLGDPLELRVMGYSLSLGAAEAKSIRVEAV